MVGASRADYDVKLTYSDIVNGHNLNKFYVLQVLTKRGGGGFAAWNRWGRVGEEGEGKVYPFETAAEAIASFEAKFLDKTKNTWKVPPEL